MRINIYKDQMREAELLGNPVLFTGYTIPREEVPEGRRCYDLCGADRRPDEPVKLMDKAPWDHTGTVLSPAPLPPKKRGFSMPCRRSGTRSWGPSGASASNSAAMGRSSGTPGGREAPR